MRIKQLSFLVCGAIMATFVLISYVTSELVVSRGVDAIENSTTSEKMRQLRNYFHTSEIQLAHLAMDWACWDDAYRYMQDKNEEFISINLQQPILEKLNLSSIGYYNADETQAALAEDAEEIATLKDSGELSRQCGLFAAKLLGGNDDKLVGIVMVSGVPHIVAAHKIRDTAMVLPANGAVVMTRSIDADFVAETERNTLLRFSILPVGAVAAAAAEEDDTLFKTVREGESISSYSIMRDVFGRAAFCLHLVTDRAIARLGRRMFAQNFVLLIVSGLSMLIAFLVFTQKRILRRILSMQRQAQHIKNSTGTLKK
jgi:Predicted periplasmic ligand-binding sensor domain